MDLKNNLLKRREVVCVMEHNTNPGVAGASKLIADKFKVTEDKVVVKQVINGFGKNVFEIRGFIYDSVEDKMAIEPRPKVKKADAGGAK